MDLPKPEIILTHESDLDGFVSGLLLQRLADRIFGDNVPLEAYHYQSWKQRDLREKNAWVSDFSFEQRLDKPSWLIIDHHPTEFTAKQSTFIHDLSKSAGSLVYELCNKHGVQSPELDRLVHLNNVADLFLLDDPDFVIANDYANLIKNYNFWTMHTVLGGKLENLLSHPLLDVMKVQREVEDPIGFQLSRRKIIRINHEIGFVETVIGNNNLIVHQLLADPQVNYPVLLTMMKKANNSVVVSFRSKNGQAIQYAVKLQGGGHPNACGATLPRSVRSINEGIDFLKRTFNPPSTPASKSAAALNSLEALFQDFDRNPSAA